MLIVRSIPLSLKLLFPLLLVYPLVLLAIVLVYLVFALIGGVLGAVSPPLGAIAASLPIGIGFMLPLLVGIRLTLHARGARSEGGYGPVIWAALGYGLLESLLTLVYDLSLSTVFKVAVPSLLSVLSALSSFTVPEWVSVPLTLYALVGGFLVYCVFRAALLPCLAGAAIGRDPNGQMHTPIANAASRLPTMFGAVLVSWVLMAASAGPILYGLELLEGLLSEDSEDSWASFLFWGDYLALALLLFWPTAIQAAAAALWYEDEHAAVPKARTKAVKPLTLPQTDLRALRKKRERAQEKR